MGLTPDLVMPAVDFMNLHFKLSVKRFSNNFGQNIIQKQQPKIDITIVGKIALKRMKSYRPIIFTIL
jgi:hypothetical protein